MNEIYWITRLDAICNFFIIVSILCFFSFGILCIVATFIRYDAEYFEENSEKWNKYMRKYKNFIGYAKKCAIILCVSVFINFFIPTTKQALLIYGVGCTIDYIKSNDTAKQLPDKCVKALDKYLDNLTKEEEKENENESK